MQLAARALGCSFDYLRRHAEELGQEREGQKGVTYCKELVGRKARELDPGFNWSGLSFDAPTGFKRNLYYSVSEIAAKLGKPTRNLPRSWYLLPGACRYQGYWYIPIIVAERRLCKEPDPTTSAGLAKIIGIKTHSLDDLVRAGRITVKSRGLSGRMVLNQRSVLDFVSANFPEAVENLLKAFDARSFSFPAELVRERKSQAAQLIAMRSGKTHCRPQELAQECGFRDSASAHLNSRLKPTVHRRKVFLDRELANQVLADRYLRGETNPERASDLGRILGIHTAVVRKALRTARQEIGSTNNEAHSRFELLYPWIEKKFPGKVAQVSNLYLQYKTKELLLRTFSYSRALGLLAEMQENPINQVGYAVFANYLIELRRTGNPEDVAHKYREHLFREGVKSAELTTWLADFQRLLELELAAVNDLKLNGSSEPRRQLINRQLVITHSALQHILSYQESAAAKLRRSKAS